jgi:hypothetical protein
VGRVWRFSGAARAAARLKQKLGKSKNVSMRVAAAHKKKTRASVRACVANAHNFERG